MALEVLQADRVLRVLGQRADGLPLIVEHREVVGDVDAALVKQSVVMCAPSDTEPPGMANRPSQTWQWSSYSFLTPRDTFVSRTMRVVTPVDFFGLGLPGGRLSSGVWGAASCSERRSSWNRQMR